MNKLDNLKSLAEYYNSKSNREALKKFIATVTKNFPDKTPDQIAEVIVEALTDEVFRRDKWPERSTSPASDEAAVCLNAALADFIDCVRKSRD